MVVKIKYLTGNKKEIKSFNTPLHLFITWLHRKVFINNSCQKTEGADDSVLEVFFTAAGQTARLVVLADAAVVPVAGIFFSVLFNCRETDTHFVSLLNTKYN